MLSYRAEVSHMFISVKETGLRLRKSRWTVMKLIQTGEIKAVKGPSPKAHYDVIEASVTDYIERRTVTPAASTAAAHHAEATDSGESL